jgi:hypothetical protein
LESILLNLITNAIRCIKQPEVSLLFFIQTYSVN